MMVLREFHHAWHSFGWGRDLLLRATALLAACSHGKGYGWACLRDLRCKDSVCDVPIWKMPLIAISLVCSACSIGLNVLCMCQKACSCESSGTELRNVTSWQAVILLMFGCCCTSAHRLPSIHTFSNSGHFGVHECI